MIWYSSSTSTAQLETSIVVPQVEATATDAQRLRDLHGVGGRAGPSVRGGMRWVTGG